MSDSLNKDSLFYNKIENNTEICGNCYRQVKSYSKPHYTMPEMATDLVEYEDHVQWVWVDDKGNTGRPSVKKTYCKCGNIDGAKLRPMDNRTLMKVCERIISYLEEDTVEIDEDEFFEFIRENRDGSDIQFNEEKFFERALESAVVWKEDE